MTSTSDISDSNIQDASIESSDDIGPIISINDDNYNSDSNNDINSNDQYNHNNINESSIRSNSIQIEFIDDTLEDYCKKHNLNIIRRFVGHKIKDNTKYNCKYFNTYYLVSEKTVPETITWIDGTKLIPEEQYYIYTIGSVNPKVGLFSEKDIDKFIMVDNNGYRRTWKTSKPGYADISIDGKRIYMHHHITNITVKKGSKSTMDHLNQNKLDNRRCNLKLRSQSDQNRNQSKRVRKDRHKVEVDANLPIEKFISYCPQYTDNKNQTHGECFAIDFADPTGKLNSKGKVKRIRTKATKDKSRNIYYKYICALKKRYIAVKANPKAVLSFSDQNVFTLDAFSEYTKKIIKQVADMDPAIPQGDELFDLENLNFPDKIVTKELQTLRQNTKEEISKQKTKARMARSSEAKKGPCKYCEKVTANKKRHEKICKQNPESTSYHEQLIEKRKDSDEKRRLAIIKNSKRVLTDIQILEILELHKVNNTPNKTLAKLYNVSHQLISKVLNGHMKPKCHILENK